MNTEKLIRKMQSHTPSILGNDKRLQFSILIPMIKKNDGLHVLFEVRAKKMRRQPGEICFPGGRVDQQDKSVQETAVREAIEELRIDRPAITHVYPFDYMISPFGMLLNTFVGFLDCDETKLDPNPAEVDEIFTVPLSFFTDHPPEVHKIQFQVKPNEDFPFDLIPGGEDYNWSTREFDEYFYKYDGKVIWGLTARVLFYFVQMIKKEG
ncbi:CoA pyrophosphatase [Pseudalkalibacillus sp. SCS-8]|uniref:NUDIX hydrolase n=1 Tax=Pseudalkalibacillus nanhaiensis TaxID=3115291 RepID=UPI0032DA339B